MKFKHQLILLLIFCSAFFVVHSQQFNVNTYYRFTTQWLGEGKSLELVNGGAYNKIQLANSGQYASQMWKITSVGVESEGTRNDWLNFINLHQLNEWTNVYNSPSAEQEMAAAGKTLILNEYDVWYYPSFFLLDEEKKFMAKKLSYEQVYELMESVLKNQ